MINYSIATQWDTDAMLDIVCLFNEKHKLHDVYGALPHSIIGHGRSPYAVPNINIQDAKNHITALKEKGVRFNYLFNGAFDSKRLQEHDFLKETLAYIKYVIEDLEVCYVTIAVPELVEIVNSYYPHVDVKISTIYNVMTVNDLRKLEGLKFNRVALGNDAPRNPRHLQEMLEYCKGRNIDLELMLTETCLYQCKTRYVHYQSQTKDVLPNSIDWYMNNCILKRILHPEEFLKACWVRPEDINYYCKLGISNFKISGRSKNPQWTKKCLLSYISGNYDGNIMEILGTTPPNFENNCEHLFSIDNKSLQYFFDHHPMNCYDKSCQECGYCEEMAIKLFETGKFTLNKICGEYQVIGGHLICEPGPYTKKLMKSVELQEGL
ncbi:U32 family peptidase [Ruminiclostridium herbifermentans]|uniref:U32 family peptidase n=1 Tax=Ruminiclostridium herbifermentans TaxID=2488810 RepID=A0A4U7JJM4_9FIRM|nr:U32 family peptidase [Ruminiclostridium herbifermentans]QNU66236.1 U32 family peptidase [Ruminiclostridium herbifermentans]